MIADERLEDEVEAIAWRLGRFDHDAIARTQAHVDRVTLRSLGRRVSRERSTRACTLASSDRGKPRRGWPLAELNAYTDPGDAAP